MRTEISSQGWRDELQLAHKYQRMFKRAIPEDVDSAARLTMKQVKRAMPVDTGRARATWGIFTPEHIVRVSTKNPANATESIWRVEDEGYTIVQGADLRPYNYIDELNDGSSKQAAAMFLDVIAEQVAGRLERAIRKREHIT